MRHGSAGPGRRSRNRGHNGGGGGNPNNGQRRGGGHNGGNNRTQVFDSNGPEVRIRGTAFQICEKYQALAKDAASSGDRVLAESYLQHAEHYQRIISEWNAQNPQRYEERSYDEQPEVSAQPADDLGLPASIVGASVQMKASPELESV